MTRPMGFCMPALAALLLASATASAQAGADGTVATTSSQARPGSLVVEPIRDSFVITPDVKVADLNHSTRTLVGAYGGLLKENTLLLGAGGYWLADGSRSQEMAYGGFVTQWTVPVGHRVRVGVRGLVGGGRATVGRTVSFQVPTGLDLQGFDGRHWMGPGRGRDLNFTFTTVSREARFHTGFFVAEPQADVVLKLSSWLALNAGAGYRAVGWASGLERQLRGAAGSLGFRIGRS